MPLIVPSIAKLKAADAPPPGAGFTTVTSTVPAEAMSAAVIAAVNCVVFPIVVGRAEPFHCTATPETKFAPFTVSVKAGEPAVATSGARLLMIGTGVDGDAGIVRLPVT